jgi:hypothetical protein
MEVESFLDRGLGHFDCVLALGLFHQLLVSERATLVMIINLLQRLNPKRIILEWVDPVDPKFRQLAAFDIGCGPCLLSSELRFPFAASYSYAACHFGSTFRWMATG